MTANQTGKQRLPNGSNTRKIVVTIIGFALSGLGLWYVFHGIDPAELLDSAERIHAIPVVGAVALYWGGLICVRAFLIRFLLRSVGAVPFGKAYRYICVGFLVNNILPLRMGEVARIGGIARASNIGVASVAGGVAIERLLDLTMAALVGVAAVQVAPMPKSARLAVLIVGCAMAVFLIVFTFLARHGFQETSSEKKGGKLKVLLWNLAVRFTAGLGALRTARGILGAIVLALLMWGMVIGVMLLRLVAFELPATLPVVLVLLTSISLGVALPSAPAYVGVYHAVTVGALTLFGIDEEVAVGFAIFSHLVDIVPSSLLGAVSMFLEGLSFADIKRGRALN